MHDEDIQATSIDQKEESSGSVPSPKKAKQQAPEALVLQELMAEAYKMKMERLKRGACSGITGDFPRATDLFFEDTEVQSPPRLDFSRMELGEDEVLPRIIYLAHLMRLNSRDMINSYLDECQAGAFGAAIKAVPDPPDEVFSAVIKELACVNLYLAAFEQLDNESPDWAKRFLEGAVSLLDRLIVGPPTVEIRARIATSSASATCREFTADLCNQLTFGTVGESCWNFIYFRVKSAGKLRHGAWQSSLTKPIDEIVSVLMQL